MAIQQRSGVRVVISEKFVEIFNWYEGDLDVIQQLYEKHKVTILHLSCVFIPLSAYTFPKVQIVNARMQSVSPF